MLQNDINEVIGMKKRNGDEIWTNVNDVLPQINFVAKEVGEQIAKEMVSTFSDIMKITWNAAIEAAANDIENRYDNHGWNYHLPSVGREGAAEIRKLKID